MFIIQKYNTNIIKKKVVKRDNIVLKNKELIVNDINFEKLMLVYSIALTKTKNILEELKEKINNESENIVITNVSSRIKKPDSIIEKMIKKGYSLTYQSLIENVNDIAGLRLVCVSEKDIYRIVKQIGKIEDINVLKKKDYIKKPKESGYSAYHIIIEVPIYLEDKRVWVKVEVQIRTMAMDFWANLEHGVKYKSSSKVSKRDSNLLKIYAKVISRINKKIVKMYKKSYQYIENEI